MMKKSTAVVLVISGSLLAGCGGGTSDPVDASGNTVTNNTYRAGYGYWHAPYHNWYPFPFNYYNPSHGYYHGGSWSKTPQQEPTYVNQTSRNAGGSSSHSSFSGSSSSHSTSRGGFGSSGHTSS